MSTNESVLSYLKSQGLIPQETDYGIIFKYQMCNFLIFKDEDDQSFLQIAMPGIYDVKEETMLDVLMACNIVNNGTKVVKAVVNDDSVWILYEIIIDSTPVYDDFIPRGLQTLLHGREIFYQALKE